MIGRTGGGAKSLHLFHEEGKQCAFVLDGGFGHGVEVGLVGRASALGHHHEAVFRTLGSLNVYLGREVAFGVHLVVHVERCVLRVAQIVLREGVVDTPRECFLVVEARPHLLSFLAVDDGRSGVLAEWQHTFHGRFGVAEKLQGHILVVF